MAFKGLDLKKDLSVTFTVVAIVFGVLIAIGFETQKNAHSEQLSRQEKLEQSIAQSRENIENLKTRQKELTRQLETARNEVIRDPDSAIQMSKYSVMDGTAAVRGPGVRITIDDKSEDAERVSFVETKDLRGIINALRSAGAEAISVNGQRIVSTSEVVMSGEDRIMINQVPISKRGSFTYEIIAIGNQDDLVEKMQYEISDLKENGIQVDTVREVVTAPSYKRGYPFVYGNPEDTGEN